MKCSELRYSARTHTQAQVHTRAAAPSAGPDVARCVFQFSQSYLARTGYPSLLYRELPVVPKRHKISLRAEIYAGPLASYRFLLHSFFTTRSLVNSTDSRMTREGRRGTLRARLYFAGT